MTEDDVVLKVARAILELRYIEMVEISEAMVSSVKSDKEEGIEFNPENVAEWNERLRWWAQNVIDAWEDKNADR